MARGLQSYLTIFLLSLVVITISLLNACASSSDTFYGLKSGKSPHSILIDTSGSMGSGVGDTLESSAARDAINTIDRTAGRINTGSAIANTVINKVRGNLFASAREQTTKIAESKRQLIPFIRGLPDNTFFNVMAFNNNQAQADTQMISASPANKENAIRFIRGLEAYGGTRMLPALELSISQQPSTIYLVSDGRPNDSQLQIITLVEDAAKKGIIINTIGVGKDQNKTFLSQIANITGGTFTSHGIDIPILGRQ